MTDEVLNHPSIEQRSALSPVVIHLLKGVIYRDTDTKLWGSLLQQQTQVREYVRVLGLELVLDPSEAYAFLRSADSEAEGEEATGDQPKLPRLVARRQLSFPVSLLLALLRKRLAEADASGGSTRLILSRADIVALMRVFLPESSNEARMVDQIDAHISKVVDLGFLRKLKQTGARDSAEYEVSRILKAFVDAQWLAGFDQRLAEYAAHYNETQGGA